MIGQQDKNRKVIFGNQFNSKFETSYLSSFDQPTFIVPTVKFWVWNNFIMETLAILKVVLVFFGRLYVKYTLMK